MSSKLLYTTNWARKSGDGFFDCNSFGPVCDEGLKALFDMPEDTEEVRFKLWKNKVYSSYKICIFPSDSDYGGTGRRLIDVYVIDYLYELGFYASSRIVSKLKRFIKMYNTTEFYITMEYM